MFTAIIKQVIPTPKTQVGAYRIDDNSDYRCGNNNNTVGDNNNTVGDNDTTDGDNDNTGGIMREMMIVQQPAPRSCQRPTWVDASSNSCCLYPPVAAAQNMMAG